MTAPELIRDLWIVGPGRLGLALGWELSRSATLGTLTFLGRHDSPPIHPVFAIAGVTYTAGSAAHLPAPSAVLLAVPDDSIEAAANRLLSLDLPPSTILHTSGVLGSEILVAMERRGWATGSLHPLVAIPDPRSGARKLRGAWFGIEGSEPALRLARSVVAALDGHPLIVKSDAKPVYHTAAVFASNYVVAVMATAVRLMTRSGVSEDDAVSALTTLARGAVDDVQAAGVGEALTGPLLRGDVRTIELHLSRLSGNERALYSVLAREALSIARSRGLAPETADRINGILEAADS